MSGVVTSRERVAAALVGEVLDRPARTLWRHWPETDQDAEAHVRTALEHHVRLGLDILKLTPSAAWMAEAWGARTVYRGDHLGVRDYLRRPVVAPRDWDALTELDTRGAPSLRREVDVVRRARAAVGPDVPVLPTVFTPLSMARYLAGEELFLEHVRTEPDAVQRALGAIARTTAALVGDLLEAGADGVYFSMFPATAAMFTEGEYRDVALAHDQHVMEAAGDGWLRVAHFHLAEPLLAVARELPVELVSWEHTRRGPSLADGHALTVLPVLGGVDQVGVLEHGTPADVRRAVQQAVGELPGRLVVATSCSYAPSTPEANLRAFVDAA